MQQGHSICCYYCLSIGLVSTITLTVQIFDKEHKSSIEEVVYIKLNDSHPCDHQYVVNQYIKNVEEQLSLHNIKSHPVLLKFLKEAMEQNLEELFFWLGAYAFDRDISEEEKKDLLFAKLVLADYYANCDASSGYEVMLMESAGENSDDRAKENTMKLLECSIRSLKAEMEKVKFASLETFKKRRFLTCLYAKDKLTLLTTFLVNSDRWGFTFVREAVVPRSWVGRHAWLRMFELIFCLKSYLDEQAEVSDQLSKEASGWVVMKQSATINDMAKI
ncbi:hypothetical protein G6F57_001159 [Rhizopus arrhizus]|uniref:Uncharacterized protein n=1 Tax=Rhizopus oryzae TaxID=64495 RepID=A0A9P6XDS2_RHIOR|nr:hypothetical protein G6F23_001654 [Rhizopus arrhizus]KAG1426950.1 hypothetical protein G6F58_001252 [Rhizopus delemar]KAG0763525.1 hypothetical protein G6F24_005944 [Rhizopus arrhizus]KAG0797620.1 hypothetical protein G6F21_000380 [Rhizopus arrhizus]KAG0798624.1 hypothetical protein G6F22_004038 [Rhizopus arrhizus]